MGNSASETSPRRDDDARDDDVALKATSLKQLTRVVAKWLATHCPHAKTLVAASLVPRQCFENVVPQRVGTRHSRAGFLVVVETASGSRVGRFEFRDGLTTTILDVSRLLSACAPGFPTKQQVMCRPGDGTRLAQTAVLADVVGPEAAAMSRSDVVLVELVVILMNVGWDQALSSATLSFSNDDRTVTRIGDLGTFPIVVADFELCRPGDAFGVSLDRIANWRNSTLTIGVTRDHTEFVRARRPTIGGVEGTAGYYVEVHSGRMKGARFRSKFIHRGGHQPAPAGPGGTSLLVVGGCIRFELVHTDCRVDSDDGGSSSSSGRGGGSSNDSGAYGLRVTVNGQPCLAPERVQPAPPARGHVAVQQHVDVVAIGTTTCTTLLL